MDTRATPAGGPGARSMRPLYVLRGVRNYLAHQTRLLLATIDDARHPLPEPLPLPPPRLRYRIGKSLDRSVFLTIGRRCAGDMMALLNGAGRDFAGFTDILDFGCGPGRLMRHLPRAPSQRLVGSDVDPEAIAWCRAHLPMARWEVNPARPPTMFADGAFDFVYAISVFTHIPEEMQQEWLAEFRRILRPGGVLLLTVLGPRASLPDAARRRLLDDGILYTTRRTGRLKLDGLPDFYQTCYHTRDYIARTWSRSFDLLRHVEQGMNGDQDAVLLRRP